MPDPTSPGGEWQHVPNPGPVNSPVPSAYPSAGNVYAQGGGYPPPPQGNYPPPGGYPPPQGNYPPPPGGYPPPGAPPQGTGLAPNSAAAIAYLTIIPAIIFLVMEPYKQNPLIRFHSFQSLALNVLAFVLWILLFVVNMVVHLVLPAGFALMFSFVFLLLDLVIWLGLFIMWLLAIIKASKGEWYKLPLIGAFCDKQARTA